MYLTDVSNASRTSLMDLRTRTWHAPTCAKFGIPLQCLPQIRSNAEIYGCVLSKTCQLSPRSIVVVDFAFMDVWHRLVAEGPFAGVPISGCLGDQQAALLGQRCAPGAAKNTYGTGCFLLLNTGHTPIPSKHGLLTTLAFQLGPQSAPYYALEGVVVLFCGVANTPSVCSPTAVSGSIAFAGGGINWLRDQLGIISSPAESETLASSVSDTAGCYFVPAFGGLLAPYWRDDARAVIMGLTAYTGRAHIARHVGSRCWDIVFASMCAI